MHALLGQQQISFLSSKRTRPRLFISHRVGWLHFLKSFSKLPYINLSGWWGVSVDLFNKEFAWCCGAAPGLTGGGGRQSAASRFHVPVHGSASTCVAWCGPFKEVPLPPNFLNTYPFPCTCRACSTVACWQKIVQSRERL